MDGYSHRMEIQVRFKDVDSMGHVNHADYLSYVELARLRFFDAALGTTDSDWHSQRGLIMARSEVNFRLPLQLDDRVAVYTRCSKLGTRSFELEWTIARCAADSGEQTAADGKTVIVCYDYVTRSAVAIPSDRREKLAAMMG